MIKKKYGVKEPNKGNNGKMASNSTGVNIQPLFDYGLVRNDGEYERQQKVKQAVEEILKFIDKNEHLSIKEISKNLKQQFYIEEIPLQKVEDSLWHQFTKDESLGMSLQGFREETIDGKKIRIPHVGFSADLDYLDAFINRLILKINDLKLPKK